MRKISFIVIFYIICLSSYAQRSKFLQEFAMGINGGMNFSKVSFLHNDPSQSLELGDIGLRSGMKIGISARYISQKHFGIQMEANFIQAGWKESFNSNGNDPLTINGILFEGTKISRRLNYLEMPLLAHIYFNIGSKIHFFVNVGPKIGILLESGDLKGDLTDEQQVIFNENDPRINNDANNNKIDYGLALGSGLDVQIGRLHTIIDGRYTFGFGDVYNNSKKDIYQRSNNQMLSITMTFLIPVKTFYGN